MKKFVYLLCILVSFFSLFNCDTPATPGEPALGVPPGSLAITINENINRSILPDQNMNTAYYQVEGIGPNNLSSSSFSERTTGSLNQSGLTPGEWTINVIAYNSADFAIGYGSAAATVVSEGSNSVSVTVVPYGGSGTLDLTVNWVSGQVASPGIDAKLEQENGTVRDLVFTISGNQGVFHASNIPAGYHTLTLKMLDGTEVVAGDVEAVRIVQNATSSGSFTYDDIDPDTGEIVIDITPDNDDPLLVTVSRDSDTKPANENKIFLAEVSNYNEGNYETLEFNWYVNGDAVTSSDKFIMDDSWTKGYYYIDVIVFTADRTRAGSCSIQVEVTDALYVPFISVWDMSLTASNTLVFPLDDDGEYDFTIDWGDGTVESYIDDNVSHSYSSSGTFTITVTGLCNGFGFPYGTGNNEENLIDISQWGSVRLHNEGYQFGHCANLAGFSAADAPDLTETTQFAAMFYEADSFNQDLSGWDISSVTDMICMFYGAKSFNQDLSSWDTSNVTRMKYMFYDADAFNQSLSDWDTSSVTDMSYMFQNADTFNGDLSGWDTSHVSNMSVMFSGALVFNQDITGWDTSSVTDMSYMFKMTEAFNQDLSGWDTSSVTDMNQMFCETDAFNGNISGWETSSVLIMDYMFYNTKAFNRDLSDWDTSNVHYMVFMFGYASKFTNGGNPAGLENWDIGSIVAMSQMFAACPISPKPSWYRP